MLNFLEDRTAYKIVKGKKGKVFPSTGLGGP
jgi:hypothetical protein